MGSTKLGLTPDVEKKLRKEDAVAVKYQNPYAWTVVTEYEPNAKGELVPAERSAEVEFREQLKMDRIQQRDQELFERLKKEYEARQAAPPVICPRKVRRVPHAAFHQPAPRDQAITGKATGKGLR